MQKDIICYIISRWGRGGGGVVVYGAVQGYAAAIGILFKPEII